LRRLRPLEKEGFRETPAVTVFDPQNRRKRLSKLILDSYLSKGHYTGEFREIA
jgi:hypothetical protein